MKPLLTKKEMDAVEDALFCELEAWQVAEAMPLRRSVWEKLCKNAGDK